MTPVELDRLDAEALAGSPARPVRRDGAVLAAEDVARLARRPGRKWARLAPGAAAWGAAARRPSGHRRFAVVTEYVVAHGRLVPKPDGSVGIGQTTRGASAIPDRTAWGRPRLIRETPPELGDQRAQEHEPPDRATATSGIVSPPREWPTRIRSSAGGRARSTTSAYSSPGRRVSAREIHRRRAVPVRGERWISRSQHHAPCPAP